MIVRGKPSAALADKLEKEETSRIEAQINRLGPEGLAKTEERIKKAKEENDAPIPNEVLLDFPVPDVSSIAWIPVQSVQDGGDTNSTSAGRKDNLRLVEHIGGDGSELPFLVQFDHVQVNLPLETRSTRHLICG